MAKRATVVWEPWISSRKAGGAGMPPLCFNTECTQDGQGGLGPQKSLGRTGQEEQPRPLGPAPAGKGGVGWRLATPSPSDRMHPGRPGKPRPTGIPGSHRTARALRADATSPSDVSRQGRKGRAVAEAPYGNGGRETREGESRKKVEGRTQGRNSERTQGCIQIPEASPPPFSGNLRRFRDDYQRR